VSAHSWKQTFQADLAYSNLNESSRHSSGPLNAHTGGSGTIFLLNTKQLWPTNTATGFHSEVPGFNPGMKTRYPDWGFSRFPPKLPGKCSEVPEKKGYHCFFTQLYKLISTILSAL
jgi:hypothetical protein